MDFSLAKNIDSMLPEPTDPIISCWKVEEEEPGPIFSIGLARKNKKGNVSISTFLIDRVGIGLKDAVVFTFESEDAYRKDFLSVFKDQGTPPKEIAYEEFEKELSKAVEWSDMWDFGHPPGILFTSTIVKLPGGKSAPLDDFGINGEPRLTLDEVDSLNFGHRIHYRGPEYIPTAMANLEGCLDELDIPITPDEIYSLIEKSLKEGEIKPGKISEIIPYDESLDPDEQEWVFATVISLWNSLTAKHFIRLAGKNKILKSGVSPDKPKKQKKSKK